MGLGWQARPQLDRLGLRYEEDGPRYPRVSVSFFEMGGVTITKG